MAACSKCLTNHGVLYICDCCGEEFCKDHINKTTFELLCDKDYQGHEENVDSEREEEREQSVRDHFGGR